VSSIIAAQAQIQSSNMPDPGSSAMSAEETLNLVEGWLRNEPGLSFKRVSTDARNLNVTVTARQYAEAKRRLGITAAPPRTAPPRPPRSNMNQTQAAPSTPLMQFVVEFLRGKPDASFRDVRDAGAAANFQVAPINYGNARRFLGIAPKAPAAATSRRRRIRQVEGPVPEAASVAARPPGGRRGRKRKLDFSNLNNLVAELQDVVAERDRLLAALGQIASIIKNV
jgi:hypothetical protein